PRFGTDPPIPPGVAIVIRPRFERADVVIGGVLPAIQPYRHEAALGGGGDPREELIVRRGTMAFQTYRASVRPCHSAVVGETDIDVAVSLARTVVGVDVGQSARPPAVGQRHGVWCAKSSAGK